jgi:hypothetical protein
MPWPGALHVLFILRVNKFEVFSGVNYDIICNTLNFRCLFPLIYITCEVSVRHLKQWCLSPFHQSSTKTDFEVINGIEKNTVVSGTNALNEVKPEKGLIAHADSEALPWPPARSPPTHAPG